MKRLALTMIVRDEAASLPEFLSHHDGLADEVVVVDTGSVDESPALARAAGALVLEHPWQDDFAAARNAALAAVTADWVLFLDADEKISPRDFARLRRAVSGPTDCVYLQDTLNYCLGTTHLEWQPLTGRYPDEEAGQSGLFMARRVGLFPAHRGLMFCGRVHESVLPAAAAAGLPVRPLAVPVHHYGYAVSDAANAARHARYRRLVALKLADDPADPAAQLEWATVLIESGEVDRALVQLEELVRGPRGLRPVVRGLVLLGRLRREMHQREAAGNLLDEAIAQDPDFVFGWLERIRTAAEETDWEGATGLLARAEARFGAGHPQLLREILRIRIRNRQLDAALVAADELVRICPQWQEVRELAGRLRTMINPAGSDA